MGYKMFLAPCYCCGKAFAFNPDKVLSLGNEPICQKCVKMINEHRVKLGFDPVVVPDDAYEPNECE